MRSLFYSHAGKAMVVALLAALPACDMGPGDSGAKEGGETGTLSAALTVGGARHDVVAVHYKVVGAGSSCSDLAIAETTSALEEEELPGGALPPGAGVHAGADGLFVLPPGDYRVCATPMSESGPSMECAPAEATAYVIPEATSEIALVAQCAGEANGGLDVIVALNDPPTIEGLDINPSKFITQCETAAIAVTASDPDGDAISYAWEVVAGAGTLSGDGSAATFAPAGAGDSTVQVTVTDAAGGSSRLSFPIHVSAADCGTPDCQVFGTDAFGYVGCSRTEDLPSCDDISLTGSRACSDDDCATSVSLPFAFDFYGTPRTELTISSNGQLGFPASASFSNSCSLEPDTVAPFWDDLLPPAGGSVLYQTLGSAPERRFVVQWNVPHINGGSPLDVRAVLFEGSNDIRFCYADTTVENSAVDSGISATAGIAGSTSSLVYSCQTPQLTDGLVLEFSHPGGDTATCSDGLQNQGETGVDCGGPCAPCGPAPQTVPGFSGELGPDFSSSGWTQCVGYRDQANIEDIQDVGWAAACIGAGYTQIRVACGADASSVRYIDVSRNVLATGLEGYPEQNLIFASSFDLGGANDIYATGNQPNSGTSWWVSGDGCDESSNSLTINNGCAWEAANCFGQGLEGDRFLYVYVSGTSGPTCDDGAQNQGETGVDCGGPCAPCGGGGGSVFTFTDTTADDVSSTALHDFFSSLGPVSSSEHILLEITTNEGSSAWCAENAAFYVDSYLSLAGTSGTAESGGWARYARSFDGAWSGPDTGSYINYYGADCDGSAYSWCSEWGVQDLALAVMPGLNSEESFSSFWSGGAGWVVRVAVGEDRLSTCGF
ncbi:Ig-like domain-containing protein [Sorangium sp. So ce1182]|uniref:Ig-like domain-containing protein n=1 Tax=Sorangium sp. So ce1182 TaxID=3133334 RepID=UPI003F60730B